MIPGAEFNSEAAAIELVVANPTWTIDELEQAEGILFDAPEEYLSDYAQGGFHPVQLGDRLEYGKYIVFHKLGHGGFSTVWLGHDEKLGRNVAIKILKADVAGWTNDGYNFGPSVFGTPITFKTTPSATMVQMALTCASRLFPLETARAIVAQVIQGLASLHASGIVHGDLHPGNVFLKFRDAEMADCKVSDVYTAYGTPEKVPLLKTRWLIITNSGCDTIAIDRAKIAIGDFGESWSPGMTTRYDLATLAFYRAPDSRTGVESLGPNFNYIHEQICHMLLQDHDFDDFGPPLKERVLVWMKKSGRGDISDEELQDIYELLKCIFCLEPEDRITASRLMCGDWMKKWGVPALEAMEEAYVEASKRRE
ncbi:SRPK2 bound unphosphorylated [Colletotrichum gloeosporioides Cg-14]|uniref:non-specific serine/threonine protein kinase n=1 Tax=Colletotrichum gloeosporioides (strain Cg-14) TaxID=1237896 RepID=T0M344_COLGC|nr:SRPK2 bound unphosphorylated [Colletotrichum gloeosporioides Cg-14]